MPDPAEQEVIRLVVTPEEDIDFAERWNEIRGDSVHPFDNPDLRAFYETTFPEEFVKLEDAERPGVSDDASDFELWEATEIAKRRQRMEPPEYLDRDYAQRTLYEECFSVNQFPSQSNRFPALPHETGMTPGGLLSHYYLANGYGDYDIPQILELGLSGDNFGEAIERWQSETDADWIQTSDLVASLMYMYGQRQAMSGLAGSFGSEYGDLARKLAAGEGAGKYLEELDTISFRLIRMLAETPEMMEPVQDEELVRKFSRYGVIEMPRAALLQEVWHSVQGLLTPRGTYNTDDSTLGLMGDLLRVRLHPEMQVFFRYLSPSGYINAARNSAQGEKPLE